MKKIDSNEIVKMRKDGLTYKEICNKTGLSKGTVSKYCRGINENFAIYENIIRISSDTIEKAQKIYDDGCSLREIEKIIGITRQTLSKYLNIKKRGLKDKDVVRKENIERVKRWKKKCKENFVDIKGGECVICGYKKSIRALHFHHVEPTGKDINISNNSVPISTLIKELEKCILVCSNCHCEIHDELYENGYSNIINKINIMAVNQLPYPCLAEWQK